ncbi:MAG: hypothetical protein DMD96_34475 [Candidatus Rokuibacteriota bacterium]|nr:MAG: hypothetical protein DMD96_34475 [Candidatus Rokubacteria bacterium]
MLGAAILFALVRGLLWYLGRRADHTEPTKAESSGGAIRSLPSSAEISPHCTSAPSGHSARRRCSMTVAWTSGGAWALKAGSILLT